MEIIIKVGGREFGMVFNSLDVNEEYGMLDHLEFTAMKKYFNIFKEKGKILSFDEIRKGGTMKQKKMAQFILNEHKMKVFETVIKDIKTAEEMFKEN